MLELPKTFTGTLYFVSRHQGAIDWSQQFPWAAHAVYVKHLDPSTLKAGDWVVGTLPVPMAAEVCALGVEYVHLTITIHEAARGQELSKNELHDLGAKLEHFHVQKSR